MTPALTTPGFGSMWLYSDREPAYKLKGRDFRASVVRKYQCEVCGSKPGEYCVRQTVRGPIQRRLPHAGRADPFHSVTALSWTE